ncbi:hypothetical protein FOXG_12005 [Fusarium oxysporum f. sp. lycopersici 4287]|uniref:Uncharacterized protein n=1 Tax=Fusarium oxysporum f. sp. lycopersici (strain 4287 / CBS 123668 / FGSC 9935 / NRRL 34936) TaxID=426428 RepID=A0A0J9VP12_FUSO4|nr:hypothetical protein FOXG_12005 [Fusarium oxysporum f. sp. lycopersici 4287]KNB12400.1 hypothetical protein FOXG_12005 [Fusarium oxysporum f. sp. lycopersici 4287]
MAEEDPKPSFPPQHQDSIQPYDAGPFVPRAPRDDETFDASEQGLGFFDVFSLIVNKMIGTGIYTSPTAVFLLTGNKNLMRFIGVTILSVICLAQFFSPSWGRKLNKFLAVVKICFLIGVIIVALTALSNNIEDIEGNDVPRAQDWLTWHGSPSKVQFAKALLAVLFSFEGWENATFLHSIHYDDFPEGHNRNYPPIVRDSIFQLLIILLTFAQSSRSLARLKFYHGLDI